MCHLFSEVQILTALSDKIAGESLQGRDGIIVPCEAGNSAAVDATTQEQSNWHVTAQFEPDGILKQFKDAALGFFAGYVRALWRRNLPVAPLFDSPVLDPYLFGRQQPLHITIGSDPQREVGVAEIAGQRFQRQRTIFGDAKTVQVR